MQTFPVEHADRIHGFQGRFSKIITKAELKALLGRSASVCENDRRQRCAIVRLTRRRHECSCGCRDVAAYRRRTRYVQGEPWGEMQAFYEVGVRLLMKQSYGLRDFKYLKLKIMDLPSRKIKVSI